MRFGLHLITYFICLIFVYRNLPCGGDIALQQAVEICAQRRAACCRAVYAGLPWLDIEREHADRRLLVLSVCGRFEAAVIHYAVAKIFGPLLFGRGWCGYACWTAMVLDLLPYKRRKAPRKSWASCVTLCLYAPLFCRGAFFLRVPNMEKVMFWSFIIGNLLYYGVGIALAFVLRDNRAFCKYICPVTVF